jgi:thioesterase domain-containing protein/acyl carrier protein
MWEQLLGIEPISVTDNFFDLGGDSLLAVRLFTQIEQQFGQKLSLATLLEAPTVEQLARVFNQAEEAVSLHSLVPIQPKGSKPPLFCIHGNGSNVLVFTDLARSLGLDRPVYGLQARGIDGKQPPLSRIEDMAACYIKEIRTVQPEGPYFLAGFSSGGVTAFEMAQQLHRQGEKVAFVALLDAFAPGCFKQVTFQEWLARQWRNFFRFGPKHHLRMMYMGLDRRYHTLVIKYYLTRKIPMPYELNSRYVSRCTLRAVRNYVPQAYPGKLTLFRAQEEPGRGWHYYPAGMPTPDDWQARDPQYGWGKVAGGLEEYDLPGNHGTMLKEPNVNHLVEKLRACLDKAQADN